MSEEIYYNLTCKHKGKEYRVALPRSAAVRSLKQALERLTKVAVADQKLMGLGKSKNPGDDETLASTGVSPKGKVMMFGTGEGDKKVEEQAKPKVVTLEEEMSSKLNLLREKHAAIQTLVAEISHPHSTDEIAVIKKKMKFQEEELVQLLVNIDSVETVGSEQLRDLRRATVKDVQGTLTKIDEYLKSK